MSNTELGTLKLRPGVGIAVIITCNLYPNSVILGKRKGVVGSGLSQLPGGHLEFGESWEDGAYREVVEETGLSITNIEFCHVVNSIVKDLNYHYVTIFMKGEVDGSAEPQNLEPDKNEGWQWVKWDDLPSVDSLFWALRDFLKAGINPFQS